MIRNHEATAAAAITAPTAAAATVSGKGSERRLSWWRRLKFRGPLLARRAGEPEALLLTLLCAIDMYTTIWWVLTGFAVEANPNLAWTFRVHPIAFVIVKCASCLPALLLAPILAQKYPKLVAWLLRVIIVVYIGAYLAFVK